MRHQARLAVLFGALVAPLSCGSDDSPPGLVEDVPGRGGASPRGGASSGAPGGEGPTDVAGQPSGGASDGPPIGEVGGQGIYVGEGGAPANPAPICRRDAEWKTSALSGVNTSADERLLAITPDERTLVFSRDAALFVWDDGEVTALTLPSGYTHSRGASLSANGLSLVVVAEDGSRFAEVSRTSRGAAFSVAPLTARFEVLNNGQVTSGDTFSSPALSADGAAFYFTAHKGPSVAYVYRAYGANLSETEMQDPVTLGTEDGQAKLVSSVSADERTLFVLDESLGYVTALWRATPAAEFSSAIAFEGFETLMVSASCDKIYGTLELGGSLDVVTGTPK